MANQLYNAYRLEDNAIRPGESPSDLLVFKREVTVADGAVVNVPVQAGSDVYYLTLQKVTTVDNAGTTQAIITPSTDAKTQVLFFASAQSLQNVIKNP